MNLSSCPAALGRKAIDLKPAASRIKHGNTVVNVRRTFSGTKSIVDVFFEISKEKHVAGTTINTAQKV